MITLNFALSVVLGVSVALTLLNYRKVRMERLRNGVISVGLEELMKLTRHEIVKNKKLVEKARKQMRDAVTPRTAEDPLDDPGLLASILAVIVKKYGAIKLGIDDFKSTGSDDYVSVYVDTKTQDLILSLDHGLVDKEKDPMSMINFGAKDDNTFH